MNLALLIIAFPASENERRGRKGGRGGAGMTGASVRRRERGDRTTISDYLSPILYHFSHTLQEGSVAGEQRVKGEAIYVAMDT